MAEKIQTLVLKVDLQCKICSKKIKKVLCKLQDRENIQSLTYDEKKSTVTVSGSFDPEKLSKKLRCKACKIIKDIQINPKPDPKPDPKPKPDPDPKPPPPPPQYVFCYPHPYPYPTVGHSVLICGCHDWCKCNSGAKPTCASSCYDGCRSCQFIYVDEPSSCSIM